jgi:hypothetical protein
MARLGGYHDSVSIGAGYIGFRRQRVQIKDGNAGRVFASTRNIQAACIRVGVNLIGTALSANFGFGSFIRYSCRGQLG